MEKSVMKRVLAIVLSATLVLTSLSISWTASANTPGENTLVITNGQLITNNYSSLTTEEKAVLSSNLLYGETHMIEKPTESDGLTKVDSDSKTIYAQEYTKDGYTWYPEKASIVVDGDTKETITLDKGEVTFDGKQYDASKNFTYTGDGYSVIVTYNVYVKDTKGEIKNFYLNLPHYMADALTNMKAYESAASKMSTIVKYVAPDLEALIQGETPLITGRGKEIIESWLAQRAKYNNAKMAWLIGENIYHQGGADEETSYNYRGAAEKIENIKLYGAYYRAAALEVYEEVSFLAQNERVQAALGDSIESLNEIVTTLQPLKDSEWKMLDYDFVVQQPLDTKSVDALVQAAIGKTSVHNDATIKSLYAGSTEISCSVNRWNVNVTVEIFTVDPITNEVSLRQTNGVIINLADGVSLEQVEAAIASNGIENTQLAIVNAFGNGIYAVNTTNYDRTVTTELTGALNADVSYKITYVPKNFTVDYTDASLEDKTVPYGTSIVFPLSDIEGQTYEYTVDGVVYEEGSSYRVTGDVSISRELGKQKNSFRIFDLVAENYKDVLNGSAQSILYNLAVESGKIYIRVPDASANLVTLDAATAVVSANSYYAGNGMTWKPYKAYVMNGQDVVYEEEVGTDGKVSITTTDYTSVEVSYRLEVADFDRAEILEALNLPSKLISEAKQQIADLRSLATYEGDLDQITYGMLDLVSSRLNAASQAAIANLAANGVASDGTTLLLSTYIDAYKECTTDAERLDWYYSNNMYAKIKEQVRILADCVEILIEDPALADVLVSLNYGEYVEKLEDVSDKLGDLRTKFQPKNDKIDLTSGGYESLITALLAGTAYPEITEEHGLYCNKTFAVTAPARVTVSATVQIADSKGNIGATSIKNYSDTYRREAGMTQADIDAFLAKIAALETELGVDKVHYALTVTGSLPEADAELTSDISIVYTWSPKTYTIKNFGFADITFTADNRTITLPGTGDINTKYYYHIGNRAPIAVGAESVTITLTLEEVDNYFVNGEYTIEKDVIDVAVENLQNFVSNLNAASASAGYANVISFVLLEDADGNLSVVLRMNAFDGSIAKALETVVTEMINQSYIEIGGRIFISQGIYVDTLVQTLLHSGISTGQLESLINADGTHVENVKDQVAGSDVIVGNANDMNHLGALLTETTISITQGKAPIPMYISLETYGNNTNTLVQLDKALQTIAPYLSASLAEGSVNLDITAPEKAHELYLALMLIEGHTNFADFAPASLTEMVEYAKELLLDTVIFNEEVTADTLINTVNKLSASTDLSGYKETLTKVLSTVRNLKDKLFDESLNNAEITIIDTDAKDQYLFEAFCPTAKIVTALNLPAGIADMLIGDVKVPVSTKLTNCNTEYTALVIDKDAASKLNIVDFVTADEIVAANKNTAIILLADVDTVEVDGTAYIDLNGHSIRTLYANGKTMVFDSRLSAAGAGSIVNFGNEANITITAGNYSKDVSAMLPDGFVQNGGVVSNKYYTLVRDGEGNITVELAADFMELGDPVAWKQIALEIAVDVALNGYTSAGLTVTGEGVYNLYNINIEDLVAGLKNTKALLGDAVESVDCDGVEGFVNDIIDKLSDFEGIANAIENDGEIISYVVASRPWKVEVEKATAGDYVTANITTGEATSHTVTLKVAGTENDKKSLADLAHELHKVFKTNRGEFDVTFKLDDMTYDENGFSIDTGLDITITADLSKREYIAVIGVIMANGMADAEADALATLVNNYLAEQPGSLTALVNVIEDIPNSQIITSLKAAKGVEFEEMLRNLGIRENRRTVKALEAVYDSALNVLYTTFSKLDVVGGGKTLEAFATDEFATYNWTKLNWKKMNIDLTLILADADDEVLPTEPSETETETGSGSEPSETETETGSGSEPSETETETGSGSEPSETETETGSGSEPSETETETGSGSEPSETETETGSGSEPSETETETGSGSEPTESETESAPATGDSESESDSAGGEIDKEGDFVNPIFYLLLMAAGAAMVFEATRKKIRK